MSNEEKRSFLAAGDLISISEAAKLSRYSKEYLSLRARTGKLKAARVGRNWITTRQALVTYIKEQKAKAARQANRLGQIESDLV